MTDCDMCGKKGIVEQKVKVEQTIMTVCPNCVHFGTTLVDQKKRVNNFTKHKTSRSNPDENKRINPAYPRLIKEARERKNITQEELAKELSEKSSRIHSIESGHQKPNFLLARKFERHFHIRLIEDMSSIGTDYEQEQQEATPLTMEEKVLAALKKK